MQIFNRSIVSHVFPTDRKVARVNAVHKKGPRNMLENYRSVSNLPVVSKVFERILYKQLVEYLDAENLLLEHQFGFRCSHSTVSALLDCSNEWYCNILLSRQEKVEKLVFNFDPENAPYQNKLRKKSITYFSLRSRPL